MPLINSRHFAFAIAGAVLVSCGGTDGGSGPQPVPTLTVSGVVALDTPIVGAQVDLVDDAGLVKASATTDSLGRYSAQFPGALPQSGYRVRATGGTWDGQSFQDTLWATYGASDSATTANVTICTTLVDEAAKHQAASTPMAGRALALQQLASIGMLTADGWYLLRPPNVDLERIVQPIRTLSTSEVVKRVVEDVADGDLTPEVTLMFQGAHGGLLRLQIGTGDSTITAFSNGVTSVQSTPEMVWGATLFSPRYVLVNAPPWATITSDGLIQLAAPAEAADQTFQLVVRAEDPVTRLGRTQAATVRVVAPPLVAEASIGPEGGRFTDSSGEVSVEVFPSGTLLPVTIRVFRSQDASGRDLLQFSADRPVEHVRITSPFSGSPTASAVAAMAGSARTIDAPGQRGSLRSPSYLWRQTIRKFYSDDAVLRPQRYTETSTRNYNVFDRPAGSLNWVISEDTASEVWGFLPPGDAGLAGKEAVLLVHGWNRKGLGGGSDTWSNLPGLLVDLGYVPFELRWRSSARFQDVAEDLRQAIDNINAATGRKVHLIAHSFGGLVARTYLQQLADSALSYITPVATLTTVGTPHSGIFSSARTQNGWSFPRGSDSPWTTWCMNDWSCHQAGESVSPGTAAASFQVRSQEGEIVEALANPGAHPLPAGVKVQVLMGLAIDLNPCGSTLGVLREGDGLITFDGQRFLPGLLRNSLLAGDDSRAPNVVEVLLGAHGMTVDGGGAPLPGAKVRSVGSKYICPPCNLITGCSEPQAIPTYPDSYRHTLNVLDPPLVPEVAIECPSVTGCSHHAFVQIRDFLARPPAIASFTATPSTITAGGSSTLAWSVSGATALSIDQSIGTVTGTSSRVVTPSVTTTYTLTATGPGGTNTASATVTVNAAAPVISSFTATPSTITAGGSSTLAWSVTGATALSINQSIGAVTGTSSRVVTPSVTTTYTLTATGPGGTNTASATVTVNAAAPVISSFTATPSTITAGGSSTLAWSVTGATALSINQSIGAVTGTSSRVVTPSVTTTYTLTATGPGGTNTASATVTVAPVQVATVTVTLATSTLYIGQGTQAAAVLQDASGNVLPGRTVTWTSSNPSVATVAASGVVSAVGAGTASITATSEGRSGSATLMVNWEWSRASTRSRSSWNNARPAIPRIPWSPASSRCWWTASRAGHRRTAVRRSPRCRSVSSPMS